MDGAVNYILYKSTSENGKYTKVGTTTKTSYTVKKLPAGKKYFYKVAVVAKDKVSGKAVNITGEMSDFTGCGRTYDKLNVKGKLYYTINQNYYYSEDVSNASISLENKGKEVLVIDEYGDSKIDFTCKMLQYYWYYIMIYNMQRSVSFVFDAGETEYAPGEKESSYWTFYDYTLQYYYNKCKTDSSYYLKSISATATFYCTYDGIYYKCKLTSGGKFKATAISYAD